MKPILFLTLLFSLNAGAQTAITPAINDGKLCIIIAGSDKPFFEYIKTCDDYREFKRRFPEFMISKTIENKYKGCRVLKTREEMLISSPAEREVQYKLYKESLSMKQIDSGPIIGDSAFLSSFTRAFAEEKSVCPHIYIAVQPDTLVWDKRQRTIESTLASFTTGGVLYGVSTGGANICWTDAAPAPIKIVCLLCHKQTEQKIKIINEGNDRDQGFRGMSYFEIPPLAKQNYYTMTDYISPFDIPKHDLKCLIGGKVVPYDAMSSNTSQETKDFYKAFEIIGSGKTFFVDGVKNVEPKEKYFWKRKNSLNF